ncbi:MAG: acyl-CoA dehydrogenase family protein [Acidimicrobiia bacterium]
MIDFEGAARQVAEDVLYPNALATDQLDAVPVSNLDALAAAGLYGINGPLTPDGGTLDFEVAALVTEILAGACLSTTFIWAQHQGLVRALTENPTSLREEWLGPLCRGERRAGVALGGLLPGPPKLRATPDDGGGWRLDGIAPWVTGWTRIDLLHTAARDADDSVVWLMVDAVDQPGLTIERQRLVAVDASVTVELRFDGVRVPAERLIRTTPYEPGLYNLERILRTAGFLSVGVADRCCRLLGPSPLDDEVMTVHKALLTTDADGIPAVRAAASELAARAAVTLVAATGSTSILVDRHPQRLAREAMFLLVFGSRPPIKAALLSLLGGPRPA